MRGVDPLIFTHSAALSLRGQGRAPRGRYFFFFLVAFFFATASPPSIGAFALPLLGMLVTRPDTVKGKFTICGGFGSLSSPNLG